MKKLLTLALSALVSLGAAASTTVPQRGTFISPTDPNIQYTGRISFINPRRPAFTYPGTQIAATFCGTSLKIGRAHV